MQDQFSDEDRHARHLLCVVPSTIVNRALQLDDEVEGMLFWEKDDFSIGHLRVAKTLAFKTRPSAPPFLWKCVSFAWEWKIIYLFIYCFVCQKIIHIKGWAFNLVLMQRPGETRKWPISLEMRYVDGKHSGSQQIGSFQTTCTLPITSAESEPSFSLMKWIKTCSRSTTPEERFSDLAVDHHVLIWVIRGRQDMPASLYTGSSKKALSCQSVWFNGRVKRYRKLSLLYCTLSP